MLFKIQVSGFVWKIPYTANLLKVKQVQDWGWWPHVGRKAKRKHPKHKLLFHNSTYLWGIFRAFLMEKRVSELSTGAGTLKREGETHGILRSDIIFMGEGQRASIPFPEEKKPWVYPLPQFTSKKNIERKINKGLGKLFHNYGSSCFSQWTYLNSI